MIQAMRSFWPIYETPNDMRIDFSSQVYGNYAMHEFIEEELRTEIEKIVD